MIQKSSVAMGPWGLGPFRMPRKRTSRNCDARAKINSDQSKLRLDHPKLHVLRKNVPRLRGSARKEERRDIHCCLPCDNLLRSNGQNSHHSDAAVEDLCLPQGRLQHG